MTTVGGQAVLEGVMMRGPSNWAVAVRKPNGSIAQIHRPIESLMARHRLLRLPVIRGILALGESLAIGFRALAISANYAAQDKDAKDSEEVETELSRGALIFACPPVGWAAMSLFKRVLNAGEGRKLKLLETIVPEISALEPDVERLSDDELRARTAEFRRRHEAGEDLEPNVVQRYSLIHPRCGTAFLLWVMVIAIFVFALFGRPAWYWLVVTRILLLPVIAGLAYELIRFAGKHSKNRVVMTLLAPGLWLQRLTTREPTLDQLEVSVRALREVLQLEARRAPDAGRVEVMA